MLRITERCQTSTQAVLVIEGWVSGKDVAFLEEEVTRRLQSGRCVVLDLTGIRAIDRGGIALLRGWRDAPLTLRKGSPFIQALMATHGLEDMMHEREEAG